VKKTGWVWLAAAALAVQAAGLGGLVARYERVVGRGTEVRIPCGAFDPVDVLRGRYLHVRAELECGEAGDVPEGWKYGKHRPTRYVLLEPSAEGASTHRAARFAKESGKEGLWVRASSWHWTWNDEEKKVGPPLRVGFPGKLFMDERLAKAADGVFAKREGQAVAVYRAWKGTMVITDVEIDGVSVKELARRARAAEAGKNAET
jgi:hypothetical protein